MQLSSSLEIKTVHKKVLLTPTEKKKKEKNKEITVENHVSKQSPIEFNHRSSGTV